MISETEAREIAQEFLRASQRADEPELAIDWTDIEVKKGVMIAPYNSAQFLETRDADDQLLDCWPILVDLSTGQVRFGRLEERDFWR